MQFEKQVVMFDFCGIPMVGNLHNGAVIGLTDEGAAICERLAVEEVKAEEVVAVDRALYEQLAKSGFFDADSPAPEGSKRVIAAYLHVTQRCNLNCAGCYSLDSGRNALADAPLEYMVHALDELASVGVRKLVISGGEPFLRADLPEIVRHAKESCGIQTVMVLCNGTCISDDALERMQPYVDCVSVSFDGSSAEAPAHIRGRQRFDELVEAIKRIQAAGIAAHMIPTVHGKNIDELPTYVRLSQELGVTMNFSLLTCEKNDALAQLMPKDTELEEIGRQLLSMAPQMPSLAMDAPVGVNLSVKSNCGAGYAELSIAADGTIYPCHMLHRPKLAMGNAFTGSIAEALESGVSQMFRELSVEKHKGCEGCRHMYLCGGGCRARSLYATGSLRYRDSYCAMTKEFYNQLGAAMKASLKQLK